MFYQEIEEWLNIARIIFGNSNCLKPEKNENNSFNI